jgi:hypothetical protein
MDGFNQLVVMGDNHPTTLAKMEDVWNRSLTTHMTHTYGTMKHYETLFMYVHMGYLRVWNWLYCLRKNPCFGSGLYFPISVHYLKNPPWLGHFLGLVVCSLKRNIRSLKQFKMLKQVQNKAQKFRNPQRSISWLQPIVQLPTLIALCFLPGELGDRYAMLCHWTPPALKDRHPRTRRKAPALERPWRCWRCAAAQGIGSKRDLRRGTSWHIVAHRGTG